MSNTTYPAYCLDLLNRKRMPTIEVRVGKIHIGGNNPIRLQSMTTTDTMDTEKSVDQSIRMIDAGCELVRLTAPSKNEAENLGVIRKKLNELGYDAPLVADIHFTPNAAEIAAKLVEKVRVNPGNYADKKKFEEIDFTEESYQAELVRIEEKFTPLVKLCKEHGTAMRIGTNHGSLSDRIMSRYGDTPMGMVESAMEFLRIARANDYHNIVLSMKASNPQVMVQAYRLLIQQMQLEVNECYPLHLGVTEAGDGEDGRVKSAAGIGTLLEDGIGDTIRVSLTEDPEFEIPVCRDLVKRYTNAGDSASANHTSLGIIPPVQKLTYNPFVYKRRSSVAVSNVGGMQVPIVIADFSKIEKIEPAHLTSIGYTYDAVTDKWNIGDQAADYIFTGHQLIHFELPGTLKVIVYPATWAAQSTSDKYIPIFDIAGYDSETQKHPKQNFVMMDCFSDETPINDFTHLERIANDPTAILCLSSKHKNAMPAVRRMFMALQEKQINNPVVITVDSDWNTTDEHLIHFATEAGALLLDGFGDGLCLGLTSKSYAAQTANASKDTSGRNYNSNASIEAFINATAFTILQATRTRISKTEYISCPSCGRTLFNLQETTAKIRSVTNHLKGVKIAIMGCIVNGPGEMADADFGYVGSGPGKITLYKGKEVVKKNVDSEIAVDELIHLLKEHDAWVDPA